MKLGIDAMGKWLPLETRGDYAFILAQYWKKKQYREHFMEHRCGRRMAIVDNGVYEGETITWKKYVQIIREVTRHYPETYYILPDVLYDHEKTVEKSQRFLGKYQVEAEPVFVCQTARISQCIEYAERHDIEMIALPIWMERELRGIRTLMTRRLVYEDFKVHLLGLDRVSELVETRELAYSVDTSLPLTLAKNNVRYIDYETMYRLPRITWDDEPTVEQIRLALRHIRVFRRILGDSRWLM